MEKITDPKLLAELRGSGSAHERITDPELLAELNGGKAKSSVPAWSEIPGRAATNLPSSAYEFGADMIRPVTDPVGTYEAVKGVGTGVLQKTGAMSGDDAVPYADAAGKFYADRYGGVDAIKTTMADDPVGFLGDLSMVMTGPAGLVARLPGVLGKVGKAAAAAGRAVDPLNIAGKGVKGAGKVGAELVGGLGTWTGGDSLRAAAHAGYDGPVLRLAPKAGSEAADFQAHLRGKVGPEEVVTEARGAIGNMRSDKNTAFQTGKAQWSQNPTPLDFQEIDNALRGIWQIPMHNGKVIDPSTVKIRNKIGAAVQEWKADPSAYNVEGFDALKRRIGDLRDKTKPGKPARYVADEAYHAVRDTITRVDPGYAQDMRAYEKAIGEIDEINKALSLGDKSSMDTGLRKLQSTMSNNVNANFGYRKQLADVLEQHGARNLKAKLAGQSLNPLLPRGLGKLTASLGPLAGAIGMSGGTATLAAPLISPRIMGETLYYGGRATKAASKLRPTLRPGFQAGRLAEDARPDEEFRFTDPPRKLGATKSLLGLSDEERRQRLLYGR